MVHGISAKQSERHEDMKLFFLLFSYPKKAPMTYLHSKRIISAELCKTHMGVGGGGGILTRIDLWDET